MKAWVVDAAKFLEQGDNVDLKKGDLITTNDIEMFLDDDDINFIIAPKGFGKTILLIYKRLLYKFDKKQGFKFIPSDGALVDAPKGGAANHNWGDLTIDFYRDRRNWESLWRTSISLSIVQKIKKSSIDAGHKIEEDYEKLEEIRNDKDGLRYPLFRRLIYGDERYTTPLAYIDYILSSFGRDNVRSLLNEQRFMDELISDINVPIAIFIDNVDEYFEEHPEKDKQDYSPSVRGMFDIEMWYAAQQGLMYAVKNMCRSNYHLDIFVSIRKEAYEKLSGTTVENIRGQCLDVHYSFPKLKKIFERNVSWTDGKFLVKPEKVHTEPIISFLGFNEIENESTGEEEDVFRYIYRHTLKRPRDIVRIGREIVKIDNEERTEENVRTTINKVAKQIAEDYIKIFFSHVGFKSESEVSDFLKLIRHNILRLENLKDVCSEFNGGCNKKDCETCGNKHVFSDLYKLGLLGIVEFNINTKRLKQNFLMPGEKTFEPHDLPKAERSDRDYYLIHPTLNELIGGDPETRINSTITIGDDKDWTKPTLPRFLTEKYKMFLCHSSDDKPFVNKLANNLQRSKIPVWFDKWNIKVGDSIVDEIDKGIEESDYLGIVISSSSLDSGWVKKELNAGIVKELERKKVVVLPILIDDVWDKVPSFLREKRYANFKARYEDGLEELMDKIIIH